EVARIDERRRKCAARVDDHGARAAFVRATLRIEPVCPFDARLLHVLEVDDVVDVAKRIHVAPADVLERRVDEQPGLVSQRFSVHSAANGTKNYTIDRKNT